MNFALIVAIVVLSLVSVSRITPTVQGCSFRPLPALQSSRMAGVWFSVFSLTEGVQLPEIKCAKSNSQVDDNGVFNTTFEFINPEDNRTITLDIVGTPTDGSRATLTLVNIDDPTKTEVSTLIDTDYDSYTIWGTCLTRGTQHGFSITVTARQRGPLPDWILNNINEGLTRARINSEPLVAIDNQNC